MTMRSPGNRVDKVSLTAMPDNFQAIHLHNILLEKNIWAPPELAITEKQANNCKQTLFQHIMQYQLISAEKLCEICSNYFHLPGVNIEKITLHQLPINTIKSDWLQQHFVLPIEKKSNELTIAIANPEHLNLKNIIQFHTHCKITWVFVRYDILCRLHNAWVSQIIYDHSATTAEILSRHLLSDAIHRHASDIHCEPFQQHYRVRIRIDGLLHVLLYPPHALMHTIINCIKILANCDIAIKRTPQDGRFSFQSYLGFVKDCRLSTYPTIHGEKIVIRLLDANAQIKKIQELGLNQQDQTIILNHLKKPQGLILVTGPTGSGKTITLYTMLHILNQTHRNIATIEDPVEIQIDGLNQSTVHPKIQFTFSNALRALLRQDPDVMMIGEIRDTETAEMAIRAAETGHLVLSTLHTNNSVEAISRLTHMGIAPFHLANALQLIIAQRLVRCLCPYCKIQKKFSQAKLMGAGFLAESLKQLALFDHVGCTQCEAGFKNRTGIFELLPITETIKNKILNQEKISAPVTLWQSAVRIVSEGKTSLDEITRVIPRPLT